MKIPTVTWPVFFLALISSSAAQNVGIGIANPLAKLEVTDSNATRTKFAVRSKNYIDTTTIVLSNRQSIFGTDFLISSYNETGLNFSSTSDLTVNTTPDILHLTPQGKIGVGNSNPATSSILDIRSVNSGILIPRMSSAQRSAITSPADGLMVYDITTGSLWVFKSIAPSGWKELLTTSALPGNNTGFQAYLTANTNCTGYCPMQFNAVVFDDGSNFNTSLHRYYAPSTGLYHFDATITVSSADAFYQVYFEKIVGGSPTALTNSIIRPVALGFDISTTISCNVKLNAGEAVHLIFSAGASGPEVIKSGTTATWFSGYRVY